MKLNIENCARNGDEGGKAWALDELVRNLKEMRDRSNTGDMQAAVTEFFEVFRFNDGVGVAALAAQPGAVGEPVKWAMCTETETPCSACPTAGTPCQARTERSRDFGDLIFALDQWKAAPPGNQSTVALNRLEAVIADLAAAPTEAKPAQDAVDAERDAL